MPGSGSRQRNTKFHTGLGCPGCPGWPSSSFLFVASSFSAWALVRTAHQIMGDSIKQYLSTQFDSSLPFPVTTCLPLLFRLSFSFTCFNTYQPFPQHTVHVADSLFLFLLFYYRDLCRCFPPCFFPICPFDSCSTSRLFTRQTPIVPPLTAKKTPDRLHTACPVHCLDSKHGSPRG